MPFRIVRCRLREERLNRGFTLDYLHRVTGLSRRVLKGYQVNKAEPSVGNALLIADALGVSVNKIWSVEIVDTLPPRNIWET